MDVEIDSEEVNKTRELIENSGAVKRVRGERIYKEKLHNRMKIWHRAARWYKSFTHKNPSFLAEELEALIKTNTQKPTSVPEFCFCIAQAYSDLCKSFIHWSIQEKMMGVMPYDENLTPFQCSSNALSILLKIYNLKPPARSTNTTSC